MLNGTYSFATCLFHSTLFLVSVVQVNFMCQVNWAECPNTGLNSIPAASVRVFLNEIDI